MLPSEHMHSENTVTLDGSDIETINFGLEKIDQAQKTCSMLNLMLLAMSDPEAKKITSINEALNHWLLREGMASTLELIGATLREVEEDITTTFEKNITFAEPHSNEVYDRIRERKPEEVQ